MGNFQIYANCREVHKKNIKTNKYKSAWYCIEKEIYLWLSNHFKPLDSKIGERERDTPLLIV